ncbi:MAG: response regulator transcription factor, partial [Anaerolineaceae bacterium]|nr:response regulator transcription factor [Anaerolineaceae bacterium]
MKDTNNIILIVDDDPVMRDFSRLVLSNAGYQIQTAEDGLQALEILNGGQVDLILLDIQMPGLDGFETLKRIQQITQTPVILFSNVDGEQSLIEGFRAGAADYIYKPPRPKNLVARVRSVLIENGRQAEGDGWPKSLEKRS